MKKQGPIKEFLLSKAIRSDANDCWIWSGYKMKNGYGTSWDSLKKKKRLAHRISYEAFVGEVPSGLDLDHLCRNRACINPKHLEPVTRRENLIRGTTLISAHVKKTTCVNGHPFDYVNSEGTRRCYKCLLAYNRARYQRKRELKGARHVAV